MTTNHKKKSHRKVVAFVGISTTLLSICGPALQSVVFAEKAPNLVIPNLAMMPDANSLINYDPDFASTTDKTVPVEVSGSDESESSEDSASSSEEAATSESSSSSSNDASSSNSNSNSSSTGSTSSNNSDSSSGNTSSNGNNGSSSTSSGNGNSTNNNSNSSSNQSNNSSGGSSSSSSDKGDSLIGKVISTPNTPITYSRNQSTAEFIEEIGEDARKIGQEKGLYASVMIAQAILESGSGNSGLSRAPNYNLFGIKGSYEGSSVEMATMEDNGSGSMYTISAKFRKYPSYKESLEDYATLMTGGTLGRSTFYQGAWKSNTTSHKDATKYLTGRYATDTRYNEKLNGLIQTYQLTQYDHKGPVETKLKKSKETEAFIKEISADSQKIAEKNDLYASVLIADAIVQSSSGNSALAKKFNIFLTEGDYKNKSVEVDTIKHDSKGSSLEKVTYKEYPSYEVGLTDYVDELKKNKEVYEEMTTTKKSNYKKVTAYMTAQNDQDRKYHKKLNALIATYDLTEFDKEVKQEKTTPVVATTSKGTNTKNEKIDILNKIGQTMTDKIFEGLEKPLKYQVTKK